MSQNLLPKLGTFFLANDTFGDKLSLVLLRWGWNLTNLFVHNWLGKARLVNLVMSIVAIPDHIKHDIFAILGPVLNGKPTGLDNCDRI